MRVLITGGSGLIGRALAASLAGDGHETIVLSREPGSVAGMPEGVRVEQWDGKTASGWGGLADGADALVNLAGTNIGEGRWTKERRRAIRESRLNAGRAVVQAVGSCSRKPRVVVQASAVGYYGPRGDDDVPESDPPGSDFLAGVVAEWEASTSAVDSMAVRRVIIRSGVVLSTSGGAFPRMLVPFHLFAGGPIGSGRQWLPWIHLEDEVRAIRFLIENESARGPYNLAAPAPATNREFSRLIGKAMHRPSFLPTPAPLLRLIFGEMSTILLTGQRAVPGRLREAGFTFKFSDAGAAVRDLVG